VVLDAGCPCLNQPWKAKVVGLSTIAGTESLILEVHTPAMQCLPLPIHPALPVGTVPLPTAEMLALMVMKEVVALAKEQGFEDKTSRAGRLTNVLVAPHSAAGLYFGDAAVKHAGL